MLLTCFEFYITQFFTLSLLIHIMNLLKEPLFSSSKPTSKRKSQRNRQNYSKSNKIPRESNPLTKSLLSSSENGHNNSIELEINSSDDDKGDDDKTKLNIPHIVQSRRIKHRSAPPAHSGGSIVIVEKPIRPQETIQAFAIRYRVPVGFIMFFCFSLFSLITKQRRLLVS